MTIMPRLRTVLVLSILLLGALALPQDAAAAEKLALRTNDAQGVPGGVVAVVVRTYASRAIGQGQILFRSGGLVPKSLAASKRGGDDGGSGSGGGPGQNGASPFAALESFVVFSARSDARSQGNFTAERANLSFNSPSRSINAADGPLAIFYFRLANWVQPGQVYEIGIDAAGTTLVDDKGRRVQVEPRNGELEIVSNLEQELEVEPTGVVKPGRMAIIGLETSAPEPLGSGRIGFRYDKTIARKPPFVRIDPRMGNVHSFKVDVSTPGLVLITFDSADGSFNRFPGALFEVRIPTGKWVRRGTRTALTLDPSLTWLADREGDLLDLELENGVLVFQ